MAAPTSRGIGTMKSSTGTGTRSLTLNTSDMPAGTTTGDRVILHVWVYIGVNNTLNPPTWPAGVTARTSFGNGGSSGGTNAIYFADFRYDAALFPMTISDLGRASTYSEGYCWATAYSPSYSFSGITGGASSGSANPVPSSWSTASFTTSGPGILIADSYTLSGAITGFNTANGFTAIDGGTGYYIAERCVAAAGTYSPPKWSRTTGATPGASVAAYYDIEDPPISTWIPQAVLL